MIKIGSRNSKLALLQAEKIQVALRKYHNLNSEIVPIITTGDRIKDKPLSSFGGKGLFIKEIEQALLDKKIDIAAHSLKDIPSVMTPGLTLCAVTKRGNPADVLISTEHIKSLKKNAVIGTCSLRRKIQILNYYPDFQIIPIRGNVQTRIDLIRKRNLDGIILSAAGLNLLKPDLNNYSLYYFADKEMLPAAGQGVVAVQTNSDNQYIIDLFKPINHLETWQKILAERSFLKSLDANCTTPIASHAKSIKDGYILVQYWLSDLSGVHQKKLEYITKIDNASDAGKKEAMTIKKWADDLNIQYK